MYNPYMTQPFLRTKTLIPPLRPNQVERPELMNKINQATVQALTLIEAPAGFGKTNLAAAWAVQSIFPVAWLTLQENDKPEERFLSYIVQAFQLLFPKIGQTTLTLIHSKPIDNAVYTLINDLSEIKQQFALVLDDYQHIDSPENAQIIQFLLENRPPNFHLIIATRNTPKFSLAKLRAKAQIIEIKTNDLRFTTNEIQTFLTQCMALSLSDLEITLLGKTTEGWPAGLQLAALAFSHNTQDWHLPATKEHIFDYLAEEVLERESNPVQQFLIQSALFDRFCLPLYNYLFTDQSLTENAADLLQHVDHANLFLIHLDHSQTWFRYHALFTEFLRKQITENEAQPFYLKASRWFEENEMLDDAIHYAIHAGEIEHAANMLEENYRELLSRGDHASMYEWIEAMPETILEKHPKLWLVIGWANMISLEPVESIRFANKAERISDEHPQADQIRIEARAIINLANIFLGNIKGLNLASESFVWLSEQDDFLHSMLHFNLGLYYVLNGETSNALDSFNQTLELKTVQKISLLYILTFVQAGETRFIRGAFGLAERSFQQAIQYGKEMYGENSVLLGLPYMSYAELLREQNNLTEAMTYAQNGIHLSYLWEPISSMDGQISMARILAAQGYWDKAFQQLEFTMGLIKNDGTILNDIFVAIHIAKLHLLRGQLSSAKQVIQQYQLDQIEQDPYYLYELDSLLLLRMQIMDAQNDSETLVTIETRLDQLIKLIQQRERISPEIEILILKSYVYHKKNNQPQVIKCLSRALTLGAQSGYVRIFADEGTPLLHLLIQYHDKLSVPMSYLDSIQSIILSESNKQITKHKSAKTDDQLVPLTRRELDILQRMACGESNLEIAKQLVLSIHTVKKHVANILSKLNVSNRTQAVILARKMSWIE